MAVELEFELQRLKKKVALLEERVKVLENHPDALKCCHHCEPMCSRIHDMECPTCRV